MNNKIFAITLLLVTTLFSCSKKIDNITYESSTAPVLTASVATTIPLAYADADKLAIQFNWTNPNYTFSTGLNSQDVTYTLEVDTTGANFKSLNKAQIVISKDLSKTFTNGEFNDVLLTRLLFRKNVLYHLEVRVVAAITGTEGTKVVSNVIKFNATPYSTPPKVTPPASGNLYITGSATAGSWQVGGNPASVPANQKFIRIDSLTYTLTVNLIGGQEYLLVPVAGDWGAKFGSAAATTASAPLSGDVKADGNNIPAPAVTGNYKVDIDFQLGKYTLTKL